MIKFGTDGWRAVIADGFTFENVRIVSQALADYLKDHKANTVVVGYDRRFLSEKFAATVAEVLAGNSLNVRYFSSDTPTPAVSFEVLKIGAAAGVVITASHNPPEYNGFKIKASFGGSATPAQTLEVEKRLHKTPPKTIPFLQGVAEERISIIDAPSDYKKQLETSIDMDLIRSSNVTMVIDSMHGTGGRWIEHIVGSGAKCKVVTIRADRDLLFGGVNPEPIEKNLQKLAERVKELGAYLGLATDGDADRVGAMDENGNFLNSHQIVAILLLHLARKRKLSGSVVKTFSQSVLIDRIAEALGLEVHETPIGFKYIAEYMLRENVLIGGEESGGIGITGHLPERDGIFNSLLLAEAVLSSGLTPSKHLEQIWREFGRFFYDRRDIHMDIKRGNELVSRLHREPPAKINGEVVKDLKNLDGVKLIFEDDSWLLLRQSGTEPVLRLYCEATSAPKVERLLDAAQSWTTI